MTTLVAPRYDTPLIYSDTGRMSREWYTFLVTLAKSHGPSLTLNDDLAIQLAMTDATNEAATTTITTGAVGAGNAVLLWLGM